MRSPRPSSPSGGNAATRATRPRYLSERQTEAYLMARELVRRVRQAASSGGAGAAGPPGGFTPARHGPG